jgi:hypothetical protein
MKSNEGPKIGAFRREVLSKTPSLSLRLRVARLRQNTHEAHNKHPPCWSSGGTLLGPVLETTPSQTAR